MRRQTVNLEGTLAVKDRDNPQRCSLAQYPSKPSLSFPTSSLNLIHGRLPKQAVNINTGNPSMLTPTPATKNLASILQLQKICEPLNLSLLQKPEKLKHHENVLKQSSGSTNSVQQKILQALIDRPPAILSLPDLHIAADRLRNNKLSDPGVPTPNRVVERIQRKELKEQLKCDEERSQRDALGTLRAERLQTIFESVKMLDNSVPLRRRSWIKQPRKGTAKQYLEKQSKRRRQLRKRTGAQKPHASTTTSTIPVENQSFGGEDNSQLSIRNIDSMEVGDSDTEKKPVRTKAQLKQVQKQQSSKSSHRVLVLQRKCKIRPGALFKCRKTREKFAFTTVHRTVTESGLSLLAAAYALKYGSRHQELKLIPARVPNEGNIMLPSSLNLSLSLRQLAETSRAEGNVACAESSGCQCNEPKSRKSPKTGRLPGKVCSPIIIPGRKSSLENPTMILVNRYTQSLENPVEISCRGGYFHHTVELLAYRGELKRKIEIFKNDNTLLDIGKRPELKLYVQPQLSQEPVKTAVLEKNSLRDALSQGICDTLAHGGFTQATLVVIEVLSEVLESYYEKLASKLKATAEKDVLGIHHGFVDPMDRLTTELGLGGVQGLADYYQSNVIEYHKLVTEQVDHLDNKLATLIATKGKGNLDVFSTSLNTSIVSAVGAPNSGRHFVRTSSITAESPLLCDSIGYCGDSRPSPTTPELHLTHVDSVSLPFGSM